MFSHLLLISCLCIIVGLILYFFHWNRFIGFLIGRAIRLVYWNEEASSIWVEIGSIHFSLIAGRILLKDVRYHSSNQTIKVVKGQIQWRYWIRRPTSEEDIGTLRVGEEQKSSTRSMHCRVQVSLQGFEWFLYNRTAAYENIMAQMEGHNPSRPVSRANDGRHSSQKTPRAASSSPFYPPSLPRTFRLPYSIRQALAWVKRQLPNLDPLDLLPIGIEVTKGAIICGNSSTPNLLVAEFRRSEGTFGVVESRSKFDLHKQIIALKFQHALVRLVQNNNYVDPMTTMGELVHNRVIQYSTLSYVSSYLSYRSFTRLWHQLSLSALTEKFATDRREHHNIQQLPDVPQPRKKSAKNAENVTPLGGEFSGLEYAIQRKILETPLLELSYYADAVGEVPPLSDQADRIGVESIDIGNGDVSPEWGFDLIIYGGLLRYGPWADRQRVELQKTFFPPTYQDIEVTVPLKPGDKRLWTAMRVFIELRDNTTLQIPFREASKDWQWDGKGEVPHRQRVREPAMIHLTVGDRSSISYTLPMVVGPSGYQPVLEVHLDTPIVTSSLNDIRLVTAESCRVYCELPAHLKWNLERKWIISVTLRQPILYLIRDHINMFIDLGKDWTTGPPNDYQRFVPMIYAFELELHHYELNMYANDHNIIDKPLIRDENALLTTGGVRFSVKADIPANTFRPESTTIPFVIEVPDALMNLSLPRWNTNALHAPKGGNSIARLGFLRIEGSYQYYAEVRNDHVEQLKLNFIASDIAFKELGWSIRYFMVIRENYLGLFTHFSTLYEYLEKKKHNLPVGDPLILKYREGKSNVLQVELKVSIERSTIILPAGLPGYETSSLTEEKATGIGACVIVTIPEIQLQLRIHDYYMEMSLNTDTISGGIVMDYPEVVTYASSSLQNMREILVLDGVDITANRLFGPQPRTATYICVWEINLGHIKTFLSAAEGRLLAAAGNAFRLNYADFPNAPAAEFLPPVDPDVTFVKLVLAGVDVTWRAGNAALVVSLPHGLKFNTNDLGGLYYGRVTSLRIPDVCVKILLTPSGVNNHYRWLEAAEIVADAFLDIYASPDGYREKSRAQLAYVEEQDRLTSRARYMFSSLCFSETDTPKRQLHKNGLYLPYPALPSRHSHQKHDTVPESIPAANHPTSSWRLPSLAQLSDSDGEERISEADRDARLAKTRSSTPIPHFNNEDDQNMTSGDESDNEDLTDASSESDWSEFGYSPDTDGENLLFMQYSRIVRQYITCHLASPNLWEGSPFIISRDRTYPPHTSTNHPSEEYRSKTPTAFERPVDLARVTTNYIFKARKVVYIKLTPLILPAISYFEEDMENDPLGPELYIDSMMASYLGDVSSTKDTPPCIFFDTSLPSIVVHILQHIVMSNGHPTISREIPETSNPPGLDAIAIVRGSLDGIVATGTIMGGNATVKAGFDHLLFTLDTSVDKRTIQPTASNKSIFNYTLNNFEVEFGQDNLAINWGINLMEISHSGPEYMVATGIAFAHNAKQLAAVTQRWTQYSSALTQAIISNILHFSDNKPIVDPLSAIQPSYLVQNGIPHKLRGDATFRFLFHLRNCLWHLESERHSVLHSIRGHVNKSFDIDELTSLLESRLVALDQDAYSITHWSSLRKLLPGLRVHDNSPKSRPFRPPFSSLSIQLLKMKIIVLDPSCDSHSELLVADVHLNIRIRSFEAVQLLSTYPTSMSQTSLRDSRSQDILKVSASILLGDITLSIFPHLMNFTQVILRVRRHYHRIASPSDVSTPAELVSNSSGSLARVSSLDMGFSLRRLRIQAGAENLIFEFGISGAHGASSVLLQSQDRYSQSMNHSIIFHKIYVQARSPTDAAKQSDQDVLASLEIMDGRLNIGFREDLTLKSNINLVFIVRGLTISVPRSALRLYRFIEEWRADFLPGIEATMQALLSELHRAPMKPPSVTTPRPSSRYRLLQLQGELSYLGISLQVMHGTWLSWEASGIIAYLNSSGGLASTFGIQVGSIALSISSRPNASDAPPSTRVKLALPPLSITGHYDGSYVHMLSLIEFVELKVKPSHWDTLLSVQQKFGQDFNDLVTLVQETRMKRTASPTKKPSVRQDNMLKYRVFLKVRGFRVGLEALSSTVYLECIDIGGGVNNTAGLAWDIELSDLAFSLAPRAAIGPQSPGFNRNHRSAFVIIDFNVSANERNIEASVNTVIQISVTKIHAVMQPSSIGQVGDFIDHLQAEALNRQDQRALELAAFKEKTQSILKTFEGQTQDPQTKNKSPWLDNYIINVSTRNIGFAFPLTHDHDLEVPQTGSRDPGAVRAFLFSIRSIEFGTNRGETGQAVMKGFSFQFVPCFRQSVASDFLGENHQTRNRLIYPEMSAQLRSTRSGSSRHIWMGADVSGFILDLDSDIPSYVFSLIDVYRQGKDRVERLSTNAPRTPSTVENVLEKEASLERRYTALPTSNAFASLTFLSGKVRVYSGSASNLYRTRSFSHNHYEPSDEQIMDLGAEVFNLPVVSVWAEYRATPASQKISGTHEPEPSILMFKSTIHSSQNTLRPTLLPFLTELVSHVETRLRKVSMQAPHPTFIAPDTPEITLPTSEASDSVSSMRISFSLRIDQSKLELTCQPDVNVVAGLHWDSGGFMVNISPSARKVTFTGSVGGLTLGLKHGFLSEDCVKLDARNLAFSVNFAKVKSDRGLLVNSISMVVDTEFLGVVRFSRLQDVLCFKAVWLDHIPIFNNQSVAVNKTPSRLSAGAPSHVQAPKHEFTTIILIRIRQITLDIDLGQSISAITLGLTGAVMRTKLTEVLSELSIFVAELVINAKGNIAGHAHVPKCVFETIRSTESTPNSDGKSRMLELRMTSGPLIIELESDHQKLLHYRAEPLEVKVFDDWSVISPELQAQERPLQLSFTVVSPEVVAVATVGTIPKLLAYVNKFTANMDAQREGASRESKTFRVTHNPKPENPLSAVAEAMLHSARSRFKEAESGLSYVIMQHISLRLDLLRLVVFPRTMDDLEIAQFKSQNVRARLDRIVESESAPGKRDLHLSFSSMTISKFAGLGHPQTTDLSDGREWLIMLLKNAAEAIIVGLPSMKMHMVSEETIDGLTTNLVYDFHSEFVRREEMRGFEDIYITLNVSLYSWLTILRKNLTREMDQVKAATDWRALVNTNATSGAGGRKKAPEPLMIVDSSSPRSATMPHQSNKPFSPFSPTTALRSSMGDGLSPGSLPTSPTLSGSQPFPSIETPANKSTKRTEIIYHPRSRHIERLKMRQLGEATPDVMHPFFMKKAGFNLEDSLPQYVNEYATGPLEEIMEVLLKLYSRQLLADNDNR